MASAPTTRTVYLPSDPDTVAAFRRTGTLDRAEGTGVDDAFARQRDLDLTSGDDEEEADFWALTDAAMRSLATRTEGGRFVVAARVRQDQIRQSADDGSGHVVVEGVSWSQVSALFVDEPEADRAVQAARAVQDDPQAFSDRAATLIAEHDLLWYAPEELDVLLG